MRTRYLYNLKEPGLPAAIGIKAAACHATQT